MIMKTAKIKAHDEPTTAEVSGANLRNSSLIRILRLKDLASVAFRKHHPLGRAVEFCQEFLDQARLDASGFLWMNQVTYDRIQPRVGIYAKQHRRLFPDFELIDGRLRQQLAIDANLTLHRFADFRGSHPLHRLGDEP